MVAAPPSRRCHHLLDVACCPPHYEQVPTPVPLPASRATRPWLVPLLLLLPAVIFILPFFVPVAPTFSESFLFGFNNRAALVLFLAVFALLAILTHRRLLPRTTLDAPLLPDTSLQPSRRALLIALFLATLVSLLLFIAVRPAHGTVESVYFLNRIGLLDQGFRPFRDFEFTYGPLQLYLPWLTARLLHLSLTDAYLLVWLLSTNLGLIALWTAIRLLDLPGRGKPAAFALLALFLSSEIASTGLNYNPLRYAAPIACLLLLERLDRLNLNARLDVHTRRSSYQTILLAALFTAGLLGLSPEIGLVFPIAILVFLPARRLVLHQPIAAFTTALAIPLAVILLLADRLHLFDTMRNFSAGSFNLPVLPGPHILLLLSVTAVVTLYLASPDHTARLSGPVGLLALFSLGMLPGALGRCDWAHVLGYELGLFLAALLLLAPVTATRRLSHAALLLVFLPMFAGTLLGTVAMVLKVQLYPMLAAGEPTHPLARLLVTRTETYLRHSFSAAEADRKIARIRAVARLPSTDPHALFPNASPILYAPFSYSPQRIANVQSPTLREGRFMATLNLFSPAQVTAKIDEMRDHPEQDLILSADGLAQCAPVQANPAVLRALFQLPIAPAPRHQSTLTVPICTYIQTHYRLITPPRPETADYGLWRTIDR